MACFTMDCKTCSFALQNMLFYHMKDALSCDKRRSFTRHLMLSAYEDITVWVCSRANGVIKSFDFSLFLQRFIWFYVYNNYLCGINIRWPETGRICLLLRFCEDAEVFGLTAADDKMRTKTYEENDHDAPACPCGGVHCLLWRQG